MNKKVGENLMELRDALDFQINEWWGNLRQEPYATNYRRSLMSLLKNLGYRKLPKDRPELRQRIIEILVKPLKVPYQQDAAEMMVQGAINQAEEILALTPDISKDKPPLLSDVELRNFYNYAYSTNLVDRLKSAIKTVAQAQRDSDWEWLVKHYGG